MMMYPDFLADEEFVEYYSALIMEFNANGLLEAARQFGHGYIEFWRKQSPAVSLEAEC